MFGKSSLYCDRTIYAYKGKWLKPNSDLYENIYYFVSKPMTLVPEWKNNREQLAPQIEITIFGGKPICDKDTIILQSGEKYIVKEITLNYLESNILVRDMLKQRIASQVVVIG